MAGHLNGFTGGNHAGKTVAYIPTAAIPDKLDFHIKYSKKLLQKTGLAVDELDISTAEAPEITRTLQNSDYIYVGGGNTFYLLWHMQRTGAGDIIKQQAEAGKPYIGESAGAILVAPNIEYSSDMDDPGVAPNLHNYDGLNLVDFYPLPHAGDFTQKKAVKAITSKYGVSLPLAPMGNAQAILATGDRMEIVGR